MAYSENVSRFFDIYNSDEALRERLRQAEEMYPGSLEIREAVVEDVLLPVAEELGLPFTLKDLRAYETHVKLVSSQKEVVEGEDYTEAPVFWLIDHGWDNDEAKFCGDR